MKFRILILLIAASGMLWSCQDDESKNDSEGGLTKFSQVSTLPGGLKIKLATGRDKGPGENCDGDYACGPCFAACIQISWKKKPAEPHLPTAKWRNGVVGIDSNLELLELSMLDANTFDNGDSTVTIPSPFDIGSEVSNEFGFEHIILQPGDYDIMYDTSIYGVVIFDAEFNH